MYNQCYLDFLPKNYEKSAERLHIQSKLDQQICQLLNMKI